METNTATATATQSQILAREMLAEYFTNGPSQRFDAINRAYCGYPQLLIEGGHCQGYAFPCANGTDKGRALCDDCAESADLERAA